MTLPPDNAEFIAAPGRSGEWAPGYADGFSGYVSTGFLRPQPPLPQLDPADCDPSRWQGASLGQTNIRTEPMTASRIVRSLEYGDPLTVAAWVKGEKVSTGADLWARLLDGTFAYGRTIGRAAPVALLPPPADAPQGGRWIDINRTRQLMSACDGTTPLRTVPVTTGMAG